MRTPRMMTDRRSTRAVIRDHASRTKDEWHQWLAREHRPSLDPATPESEIVPWMSYVNNVYTVTHHRGAPALLATRHVGRWRMSELQRIVDELIGHGVMFAVAGRMTADDSATLLIGAAQCAVLDQAFEKKTEEQTEEQTEEKTDVEAV